VVLRLRINPEDIIAAGRPDGVERIDQIQFAVVEPNGGISIVRKQK
jgi:uncharacterized membrane protein YcaP (DUF421 family)